MSNHSATDAIIGIEKLIVDAGIDKVAPDRSIEVIKEQLEIIKLFPENEGEVFRAISCMATCLMIIAKQRGMSFERCLIFALATLSLGQG